MKISPLAGHLPPQAMLLDVAKLVTAYYAEIPDPTVPTQRVAFGTSGHRGSSFEKTFNEWHVIAISEAICRYRRQQGIDGPLFLGADTHALSAPASTTAVEVLAANGIDIMLAEHDAYTPTPAVSQAILNYNRGRSTGLAPATRNGQRITVTIAMNTRPTTAYSARRLLGMASNFCLRAASAPSAPAIGTS